MLMRTAVIDRLKDYVFRFGGYSSIPHPHRRDQQAPSASLRSPIPSPCSLVRERSQIPASISQVITK